MANYMKRLLLLLTILSLVLAVPATILAQDEDNQGEDNTEQVEDGHSEDAEGEESGGEESSGGFAALGLNAGFVVAQIVNFTIILGLLTAALWRPAINMLDRRTMEIEKGLDDAAVAAKARQDAEAEAEKILAQARSESARAVEEARGRGDEVAKTIESNARSEAEKIVADAQAEALVRRDQELAGLRDQVLNISTALAGRVINQNLDKKKQESLISDFFSNLPADAKSLQGDLTVVSAMPLSDSEQNNVKKELGADNVTFEVDPSILGGLIVRSADRVVDGSVRSNLSNLSESLA